MLRSVCLLLALLVPGYVDLAFAQAPKVIKVRMDQNVVTHGISNAFLRESLVQGLALWKNQTNANVEFQVVDRGGYHVRVKNKEVYLGYGTYDPPGAPKTHWSAPAYATNTIIWVHTGHVSKNHTSRVPPVAYDFTFPSFQTREKCVILFGHEFGHTKAGSNRPHTPNINCLMNIGAKTTTICAPSRQAFEAKYGLRPGPPIPPSTSLNSWRLLVESGAVILRNPDGTDGETIQLEQAELVGVGGTISQAITIQGQKLQIVDITAADAEAEGDDDHGVVPACYAEGH